MGEQLIIEEFATPADGEPFLLELGSWEGPLDLLLALARSQKVDLREISILALVEQYLDFIANAKALKLEIAADYLVMAAWLAYLKSCLLLPREPHVDPSPEELALRLQLRLERLNAMREAGARLMGRDRLGRDVFARGLPDGLRVIRKAKWDAQIFDLIQAYGHVKARAMPAFHIVTRRHAPGEVSADCLFTISRSLDDGDRALPARNRRSGIPALRTCVELCRDPRAGKAGQA